MVVKGPWRVPNISNRMFSERDPRNTLMGQLGREIYLCNIIDFRVLLLNFVNKEDRRERNGM